MSGDGLAHQQPQPAGIGIEPIGRQAQEHGSSRVLQPCEREIGRGRAGDNARTVEKVGVALRRGQHPGGFRDPTCRAGGWRRGRSGHQRRCCPAFRPAARRRRQGQASAMSRTVARTRAWVGSWTTVCRISPAISALASSFQWTSPDCPGASCTSASARVFGIFREIEAGGVEPVERIVAGRGLTRHTERIEAPDLALRGTCAGCDAGVLPFGIDADHRTVEQAAGSG